MRALVVYESMYGNTHVVADHIAEGLRREFEVEVLPVAQATKERVAAADLVVVGGPTHAHGMSSRQTRKAAVDATKVKVDGLEVDADATGEGLRDWFHELGQCSGAAAAFDTRLDIPRVFAGHASGGIARRLRHAGFKVISSPTSFFVTKQERLAEGEADRATVVGSLARPHGALRPLGVTRRRRPVRRWPVDREELDQRRSRVPRLTPRPCRVLGRKPRMAVSVDLTKALDKAYENKSLEEILAAPPSALAGLT